MIGAAQRLEAAARRLKEQAKHVRQGVLHSTMTADLWTMHKAHDIETAASAAVAEINGTERTL
jgi:HAMP domain-containing protein